MINLTILKTKKGFNGLRNGNLSEDGYVIIISLNYYAYGHFWSDGHVNITGRVNLTIDETINRLHLMYRDILIMMIQEFTQAKIILGEN